MGAAVRGAGRWHRLVESLVLVLVLVVILLRWATTGLGSGGGSLGNQGKPPLAAAGDLDAAEVLLNDARLGIAAAWNAPLRACSWVVRSLRTGAGQCGAAIARLPVRLGRDWCCPAAVPGTGVRTSLTQRRKGNPICHMHMHTDT